ncbi:MAG: HNH endonuclease [Chloroflexi bacterium]|nr:HNH endonuclease [Chloroflexota bacterium]
MAQRASHHCEYCHAPEVFFNIPFEVDHIIPTSKSGAEVIHRNSRGVRWITQLITPKKP